MYLKDEIQATLRELGKISKDEVVKKEADLYIAVNVLTNESRILSQDYQLIESLKGEQKTGTKRVLKG